MLTNPKITITSSHNRRITEVRKLYQRKYRRRQNRFMVEGTQLINMALDAGAKPVEVFFCENQLKDVETRFLLDRFLKTHADLLSVTPYVMKTLSDHNNPQSILATFANFETPIQAINLRRHELIVIVERPQSPANLGMIFRTGDAVGAGAIVLIPPCVDPLHPKAVRVSLGTVFNVPFVQISDMSRLFNWLQREGFSPVGTDPNSGEWDQEIWKGKIALILGSDVLGTSNKMRPWVKKWVQLPMVGKVESLSSAIAGSVLMYEWFGVNRK